MQAAYAAVIISSSAFALMVNMRKYTQNNLQSEHILRQNVSA